MKRMGKVIGSSLFSLLLLLGLVLPMQTTVPVLQPMTVAANDLTGHLPATGEVKGDGVFGYTTNYVCYGGAIEEQHAVQNGWHITLKNHFAWFGINSTFNLHPSPFASLFNIERLGFRVPFSIRLISACVIPVLSDNSFCVIF